MHVGHLGPEVAVVLGYLCCEVEETHCFLVLLALFVDQGEHVVGVGNTWGLGYDLVQDFDRGVELLEDKVLVCLAYHLLDLRGNSGRLGSVLWGLLVATRIHFLCCHEDLVWRIKGIMRRIAGGSGRWRDFGEGWIGL